MQKLTPYLMFGGDCEAAHSGKVMHAMFQFEGGGFMASDYVEGVNYTAPAEGSNVHLNIGFDNKAELENAFNSIAEGGVITMELQPMFWGDRFGRVQDRFGMHWMFSGPA